MQNLVKLLFTVCFLVVGISFANVGVGVGAVDKMVKENHIKEVSYEYVLSKIGDGRIGHTKALILDARPAKRYNTAHIPGAVLFPDTQLEEYMEKVMKDVPKDKEIITYCQGPSCEKSVILAVELIKRGYKNTKVYRGGIPEWEEKNAYVDIGLAKAKTMYDENGALFIDARPFGKFKQGTIVGSINIPDTSFNKLWGRLPTDTKTPVVIFCGGLECEKSHIVAQKMVSMGYTKVATFSEGYPAWKKAGFDTTEGGSSSKSDKPKEKKKVGPIVVGGDEGSVDVAFFNEMIKNRPENIMIVDIRDAADYKKGHIKGSVNIPKKDNPVEKMKTKIDKDKYVIFTCGTGTRALEMWIDFKSAKYENLDKIHYLDAKVNCKGEDCTIEGY